MGPRGQGTHASFRLLLSRCSAVHGLPRDGTRCLAPSVLSMWYRTDKTADEGTPPNATPWWGPGDPCALMALGPGWHWHTCCRVTDWYDLGRMALAPRRACESDHVYMAWVLHDLTTVQSGAKRHEH